MDARCCTRIVSMVTRRHVAVRVLCFHGHLEAGFCIYIVFSWLQEGTLLYVYSFSMITERQVVVHV